MNAQEWIDTRHDGGVTPNPCKSCVHRYNDIEEGHNCRRYDATITLSDGDILEWPGQAVSEAIKQCGGEGYERRLFGRLLYWLTL